MFGINVCSNKLLSNTQSEIDYFKIFSDKGSISYSIFQ